MLRPDKDLNPLDREERFDIPCVEPFPPSFDIAVDRFVNEDKSGATDAAPNRFCSPVANVENALAFREDIALFSDAVAPDKERIAVDAFVIDCVSSLFRDRFN